MLKNIINSHCAFNLKETQVCVRAKTQNAEGLQLIFSTSVWSKTVYHKYIFLKLSMGFETVCPEKDRQTAFYSPLGVTLNEIREKLFLLLLNCLSSNSYLRKRPRWPLLVPCPTLPFQMSPPPLLALC